MVAIFHCPSRRPAIAYPSVQQGGHKYGGWAANSGDTFAKSDYAANGGTYRILGAGPGSLSCLATYPDCDWRNKQQYKYIDGISNERTEVKPADITDGTHCTYFAGEKYMNPYEYYTGWGCSDNSSMYQGNDWDVNRWCKNTPEYIPMQDTPGFEGCTSRFGSVHFGGFHMVMCDGSVQRINYAVDGLVHEHLGNRKDRQTIQKLPW